MSKSKSEFFHHSLVPAGQLALLVQALASQAGMTRQWDEKFGHALWDPLNLLSWFVLQNGPVNLSLMDDVARSYLVELKATINAILTKATRDRVLASIITSGQGSADSRKFASKDQTRALLHKLLDDRLQALAKFVYEAIGYTPQTRHHWIHKVRNEALPWGQALDVGGWKTFVRNSHWNNALSCLGITSTPPAATAGAKSGFSSHLGRERLRELWREVFALADTTLALGSSALVAETSMRVPVGVQVTMTPSRLLQVHAKYDPRKHLTQDQETRVAAVGKTLPDALISLFRPTSFSRLCGCNELTDAVTAAWAWLAEVDSQEARDKVQAEFAAWEEAERIGKLQATLTRTFSATDRHALIELIKDGKLTV